MNKITDNKNLENYLQKNKIDIVSKWKVHIKSLLPEIDNKEIIEYICLYAEKLMMEESSVNNNLTGLSHSKRLDLRERLEEKITEIKNKSNKLNIKIVDRIYNPIYNKVGYLLENGETIFTEDKIEKSEVCTNSIRKIILADILNEDNI